MRTGLIAVVLAAVSTAASAQYGQYDPRSNIYNNETLRRQDEIKRNEEAAKRESFYPGQNSEAAEAWSRSQQNGNAARSAQTHAELKAARARLLKMAPLPDDRNPLLGRWRVEGSAKPQRKDDLSLLMGMLANPGGAACQMVFGSGIIEFKSKSWASIDGHGDDSLGPIVYRGDGKRVWAIPDKGIQMMGFEIQQQRAVSVNMEGCTLVRVGGATPTAQSGPSNRATAPSNAGAPPPMASVTPAPPRSTLSRPSPEVCRNTLVDQLGVVGVNQVRAMSDVRFKEAAIEGKVPNSNDLRIDLRGSACDDPRIKATLYDFDANAMLQSITLVWERPPGPAPAPIFAERVTTLSRFHPSLPQPQSTGRLQGDTSLGRLILQDMPARNLLLESYAARK